MKILFTIVGIIALLFLIFVIIGILAPRSHEGKVSATYDNSPEEIWRILSDIESLPDRRREIVDIEILEPSADGFKRWKELTDMRGYAIFEMLAEVENELIEISMTESTFGITGTWKYEIQEIDSSTTVTITENSTTCKILVRSMLTIAGRNATLKQELKNLEKALKE